MAKLLALPLVLGICSANAFHAADFASAHHGKHHPHQQRHQLQPQGKGRDSAPAWSTRSGSSQTLASRFPTPAYQTIRGGGGGGEGRRHRGLGFARVFSGFRRDKAASLLPTEDDSAGRRATALGEGTGGGDGGRGEQDGGLATKMADTKKDTKGGAKRLASVVEKVISALPKKEATSSSGADADVVEYIQPHAATAEETLQYFGVTQAEGLSASEAAERLEKYGRNQLTEGVKQSLFSMVLEQFEDRLVQILLLVALTSGILSFFEDDAHAFIEPLSILVILVLNAVIGVWQTKSAADSLDALKKLQPETACVLRAGQWISAMPAAELVPGDVVYLRVGDKLPADARILALKTSTFSSDEGSLTGESVASMKGVDPVDVDTNLALKRSMVFAGTMVTGGSCWAVVTATGMRTEIGKIQAGVQEAKLDAEKTPLEKKLDDFGSQLSWIIGIICLAVWGVSIPHFDDPMFGGWAKGAVYYAKVAVALGVAAIPEGLPAVITLCLSLGTRRMAKRNVIVRKLPSVETLGCTTIICTDKTGTLTTNQMTVVSMVTCSEDKTLSECEVQGTSYDPIGTIEGLDADAMASRGKQVLAEICSLCNDASIIFEQEQFSRVGEPTEAALLVLTEKLGVIGLHPSEDNEIRASQCATYWSELYHKTATLEFSRDRKSMSVLCRPIDNREGAANRLFVKGAPELLLPRCSKVMLPSGKVVTLTAGLRKEITAKFAEMAVRPLRCLALAVKEGRDLGELADFGCKGKADDPAKNHLLKDPKNFANIEDDCTFVGLVGIKDPARPEVAQAMKQCQEAGVRVMVITGDGLETAVAIARDVNIFDREEDVSEKAWVGAKFFKQSEERQKEILSRGNLLFCRTEPKDKQRLVKMLQEGGEVPAMTGDGVNDAPALQQAAIGIAMGIAGTEVSKDAADMILADDNFATIVSAVEEGRAIYNNMQAFICFLISCNIGEIVTIFVATLLGLPEPLTPLHLLWVNLVTDGPPATALGFNPPDPDAMSKPPRPRDEPIMSRWLLTRYCATGLYVGFATIGVFVHWYMDHGVGLRDLLSWSNCGTLSETFKPVANGDSNLMYVETDPCGIFSGFAKEKAQTLSLSVLVTMEMLKALSAVSVDNSIFRVPPWRNKWLLVGVALPSLLHFAVLYAPGASEIFGLQPLTQEDWLYVLAFGAPIMIVEEILKAIGRRVNAKKIEEQQQQQQQGQGQSQLRQGQAGVVMAADDK